LASSFGEEEKKRKNGGTTTNRTGVGNVQRKRRAVEARTESRRDRRERECRREEGREERESGAREEVRLCVSTFFLYHLLRGENLHFLLYSKDFRETDFSMNIFSFLFFVVINRAHLNEIANYDGDDPLEVWLRCAFSFSLFSIFNLLLFARVRSRETAKLCYFVCSHYSLSLCLSFSL